MKWATAPTTKRKKTSDLHTERYCMAYNNAEIIPHAMQNGDRFCTYIYSARQNECNCSHFWSLIWKCDVIFREKSWMEYVHSSVVTDWGSSRRCVLSKNRNILLACTLSSRRWSINMRTEIVGIFRCRQSNYKRIVFGNKTNQSASSHPHTQNR